jgi:hypothetical protein
MTPAERRYRRVLRLLPTGYRRRWEQDMVSAYLDSVADTPRRAAGELLAVAWLVLRLRLNGYHATPRSQLWYQTVLGIAMLTTLYESLDATRVFADLVGVAVQVEMAWPYHVTSWWGVLSLVWVATFVCVVRGRVVAARVLVLVALIHQMGLTSLVVAHTVSPGGWGLPPDALSTARQAGVCVAAVTVFLIPQDFRPARGWLAAFIVPAVVVIPVSVASAVLYSPDLVHTPPLWLAQLQLLNVGTLLHVGMVVGMVVALARAHQWLRPLALFGGGVAAGQRLGFDYGFDPLYDLRQRATALWTSVTIVQLVVAVACVVAGFVAMRHARIAEGRPDAS